MISKPAAPGAPVVSAGNGQLTVTWTAVEDALSYELWLATENNSAAAEKKGEDISGTLTKTISGLTNRTTYYVWVKAKNSKGESGFSLPASGTPLGIPAAPSAPGVTSGNSQLIVTWTAVDGASAYELWLASVNDSAAASKQGGDISGGLSQPVTGLTNGTTYYVWVKAKNSSGSSGFSSAASGTPSNTALSIGFNYNEIVISGSDGVNAISKTGAAGRPRSLVLRASTGYTAIVWYVDGDTSKKISDSGTGITLAAANYSVQSHSITFTGKLNGVLYSRTIPFTVYD
jgi:hypothetical protein